MITAHNPYPTVFNWLCAANNIPADRQPNVATAMKQFVRQARETFYHPMGRKVPYNDGYFRGAYLLAYFPYYIEPVYHALELEKSTFAERPDGVMKALLLGGGPCPEALGLAAYLRDHAPHITAIHGTVFDREKGWGKVQHELVPLLAPAYCGDRLKLSLAHRQCDIVNCGDCGASCDSVLAETDYILSQNFLTEIYTDRKKAYQTLRNIIVKSKSRSIQFIENAYKEIFQVMGEVAGRLHAEGLTKYPGKPKSAAIRPRITIPDTLLKHLFTGESWLIPKRNVKFHHMKLWITR